MAADTVGESRRHRRAAEAFVERVRERELPGVERLYLFGSTARGEADGLASDVDFLVVLSDAVDRRRSEAALREAAYDAMLEHGPVVELHVLTESAFERRRKENHPFVRRVLREGRLYA